MCGKVRQTIPIEVTGNRQSPDGTGKGHICGSNCIERSCGIEEPVDSIKDGDFICGSSCSNKVPGERNSISGECETTDCETCCLR